MDQRAAVIERFRSGNSKLLITTNVAARGNFNIIKAKYSNKHKLIQIIGIDVEDVSLVFNYDLPADRQENPDFETYLHRIGRTGRFGKVGIAINLVSNSTMHFIEKIQNHFGKQIKKLDPTEKEELQK